MKATQFTFVAVFTLASIAANAADLFNNTNIDGVSNGGKEPTVQLSAPAHVTEINTYHWNNGRGAAAGTIALRASNGQVFGPFNATTPLLRGLNRTWWYAAMDLYLPAGNYAIVDSDPSTWSYNVESKLFGFAIVAGDYEDAPPVGPAHCAVTSAPVILYTNSNVFGVNNNPPGRTAFGLSRPACITEVDDYHWNYGAGAAPAGTISLELQHGGQLQMFGPFRATATNGAAANVNWVASVNQILPAGSYLVNDSEPATWSQNAQSDYRGFTTIWGVYMSSSQPAAPPGAPPAGGGAGGAPAPPVSCPSLLGPGRNVAVRANPTSGPAPLTVTFTLCQRVSSYSLVTDWTLGPLSTAGSSQLTGPGTPPTTVTVTYTGPGQSSPEFCVDNTTHTGGCASLPSPIVIR